MSKNKISSGSYDLNKWLYGGYEKGVITMIVGPPGSGKTNLVMQCCCSQAKKGNKVIFIDTEGGFSVERVRQISGDEDYENVLKNIFLLEPTNFEEQKSSIEKMLDKLKKEHIGLIAIDGISMLYRLERGDACNSKDDEQVKEINRQAARQMRVLAEISRKQKIPVLITNQVYGSFLTEEQIRRGEEKEVNIVGGDLFKYWSKCIIELQNNRGKRKAIILKHRSLGNKELVFEIRNKGIFKKGWI